MHTSPSPSASEVASETAAKLVRRYYGLRDQLRQKPTRPLRELRSVTTSIELKAQLLLFHRERSRGLRQTGATKINELRVESVNLDNSDPATGHFPTVQVDVCWDVSRVDILDRNGKSVVLASRPNTGWIRYTVANYHAASDPSGGWRVATSQDIRRTPCVAS